MYPVLEGDAIQEIIIENGSLTVDIKAAATNARTLGVDMNRGKGAALACYDARSQQLELQIVAPVERQFAYHPASNQGTDVGFRGLQHGCGSRDGHLLSHFPDSQDKIHFGHRLHFEPDIIHNLPAEAG